MISCGIVEVRTTILRISLTVVVPACIIANYDLICTATWSRDREFVLGAWLRIASPIRVRINSTRLLARQNSCTLFGRVKCPAAPGGLKLGGAAPLESEASSFELLLDTVAVGGTYPGLPGIATLGPGTGPSGVIKGIGGVTTAVAVGPPVPPLLLAFVRSSAGDWAPLPCLKN